jgi:hypothetical protein
MQLWRSGQTDCSQDSSATESVQDDYGYGTLQPTNHPQEVSDFRDTNRPGALNQRRNVPPHATHDLSPSTPHQQEHPTKTTKDAVEASSTIDRAWEASIADPLPRRLAPPLLPHPARPAQITNDDAASLDHSYEKRTAHPPSPTQLAEDPDDTIVVRHTPHSTSTATDWKHRRGRRRTSCYHLHQNRLHLRRLGSLKNQTTTTLPS